MKSLKEFNCKSNPFDVLAQSALEYARAVLFTNSRLRNGELPKDFSNYDDSTFELYLARVNECINILNSIPEEELEICRRNSLLTRNGKQSQVNDMLFALFNEFDTEYSKTVPYLSEEMERVLFGVNSPIYQRHKFLQGFYKVYRNDEVLTEKVLMHYLDYLDNGIEYCREYFSWSDKDCELVERLHGLCDLSSQDAEYLVAVIKKDSDKI